MHIKTIRHKGNSIKKLLQYMTKGLDQQREVMIAHNLPSFDMNTMASAFLTNDSYRQSPAKVKWYHEVLSFSPADREHINYNILEAVAQQYIRVRNPNALCFAVSHTDKAHRHLHFCFSGTEYRSKKTLRMSDTVFRNLREEMELYQMEHYPMLQNSIAYVDGKRTKKQIARGEQNTRKQNEYQTKKRLGAKQTEKEKLSQILLKAYDQSKGRSSFFAAIEKAGIALSSRNGKVNGVTANRKYRFSTLGISKEMLLSLDVLEKRWTETNSLTGSVDRKGRER